MKIIAHRGFWKSKKEQNTLVSIARAIEFGFGVETDFRDFKGRLVLSHNIPNSISVSAEKAFEILSKMRNNQTLAINVKSCHLQKLVATHLRRYRISKYFVFDTSVPDALGYIHHKLRIFTRLSEFEQNPSFLKQASGVWVDSFKYDWFNISLLKKYLKAGKEICIVSPELHNRPYLKVWKMLKSKQLRIYSRKLALCTDHPLKAKEYFSS